MEERRATQEYKQPRYLDINAVITVLQSALQLLQQRNAPTTQQAYLQMEIEDASLSEVDRMSEERVKMKRKFLEFSNQSIDKFKNFY